MTRFFLCTLLFSFFVPVAVVPAAGESLFEGTFIQLLDRHRDWSRDRWGNLLDEMTTLGVEEVVVQWTLYDQASFLPSTEDPSGETTLERLLAAADRRGVRITVGLAHDSGYWDWIGRNREARLIEVSLRRLEERHALAAEALSPFAGRHASSLDAETPSSSARCISGRLSGHGPSPLPHPGQKPHPKS